MNQFVECQLCKRKCRLVNGQRGDCRSRVNIDGKLQTLVYGKPCAIHVDPIEKKPLFHVLPGTSSFSIATAGCNLHCKFCQNWEMSQINKIRNSKFEIRKPEKYILKIIDQMSLSITPKEIVEMALQRKADGIAYTYNEPAKRAKKYLCIQLLHC